MTTILDLSIKKKQQEPISMVTCYDATMARIIAKTNIDMILVGDSVAMTKYGYNSTIPATMDMMLSHVKAVAQIKMPQLIVADLPFLSYRTSISNTVTHVQKLMQAGAHAIKLEGSEGNLETISHLVESGVPMMGHLGLTPQMIHQLGGYSVQGKEQDEQNHLLKQSLDLQNAGCFALILECIPPDLGKRISEKINIPCIGIGAGPDIDGQVLVLDDLLGLNSSFKPKFVKQYLQGEQLIQQALNSYASDVINRNFPEPKHSYASTKERNNVPN
jgi:3-methyl-2-oxobutanoate hydroxymethyltransferase